MTEKIGIKEREFMERIDAKFPYKDAKKIEELISQASSLSMNAVFTIVYETVCMPRGQENKSVTPADRVYILSRLRSSFEHPLKDLVLGIAERSIQGIGLSRNEVLAAMKTISAYPKLHQALSVVLSAGEDAFTEADEEYDRIIKMWYPT